MGLSHEVAAWACSGLKGRYEENMRLSLSFTEKLISDRFGRSRKKPRQDSAVGGELLRLLAQRFYQGTGNREDDRPDDDAEEAEDLEPAEDREEHHQLVQTHAAADEFG